MREFCPQPSRPVSLCEALDRLLSTGVVALGDLTLSVADVDLVYLGLQLVVTSVEGGRALASPGARVAPLAPAPAGPPRLESPAAAPLRLAEPRPANACAPPHAAHSERGNNGLAQLVLTLIKLLHELLKRQALRRIQGGGITAAQVERLRQDFGLAQQDLNLDLGPLGRLL